MPMARQVRMMRDAISPRLAMRILRKCFMGLKENGKQETGNEKPKTGNRRVPHYWPVSCFRFSVSCFSFASHSKHAEAVGALDAVVERGAEGDAEHGPGVARIDHAVIPDPRRGVERVRLLLDLLDDHLANGLVLLLVVG